MTEYIPEYKLKEFVENEDENGDIYHGWSIIDSNAEGDGFICEVRTEKQGKEILNLLNITHGGQVEFEKWQKATEISKTAQLLWPFLQDIHQTSNLEAVILEARKAAWQHVTAQSAGEIQRLRDKNTELNRIGSAKLSRIEKHIEEKTTFGIQIGKLTAERDKLKEKIRIMNCPLCTATSSAVSPNDCDHNLTSVCYVEKIENFFPLFFSYKPTEEEK